MTAAADPRNIDWDAAIDDFRRRFAAAPRSSARSLLAEALSLAAFTDDDYPLAAARLAEAARLEPLNPIHRYRRALLDLRFGRWTAAAARVDALRATNPFPHALYALVLAYRGMNDGRAKNVAVQLKDAHPAFTPGLFAHAEIQVLTSSRFAKVVGSLPRRAGCAPLWCDLLCKIAIERPDELASTVKLAGDVLGAGSAEERLLRYAGTLIEVFTPIRRTAADQPLDTATVVSTMAERLAACAPQGPEELLLLLFAHAALQSRPVTDQTEIWRELGRRLPDRLVLRRLECEALTRLAVEQAKDNRLQAALATVVTCLELEPHETTHWTNRAALFTLLRDERLYHEAWLDLDRHHFRLALAGNLDPDNARHIAKIHRMFAEQARLTPEHPDKRLRRLNLGVFREETEGSEGQERTLLVVNHERMDSDPEQFRQWLHHRRAEILFAHLAAASDPHRALLEPADPLTAGDRAAALVKMGESLGVLVAEEGGALAQMLQPLWQDLAARAPVRYSDEHDPENVLADLHLATLADVVQLCWESPSSNHPELVDELLELVRTEIPFLDERHLQAALAEPANRASRGLLVLRDVVSDVVRHGKDAKDGDVLPPLTRSERERVAGRLIGRALTNEVMSSLRDGALRPEERERFLGMLDEARASAPDDPYIEWRRAQFLVSGGYFEEAREAIARVNALTRDEENPYEKSLEELQQAIDKAEREKAGGSKREGRGGSSSEPGGQRPSRRREELEAQLDNAPASIPLYEDLARLMAAEGNFDSAVQWSEQAMARCLTRGPQLRARALNLELSALRDLALDHAVEVRLYLGGTRLPLLEKLELLDRGTLSYGTLYILGHCLAAARRVRDAEKAFAAAVQGCTRGLHLAVLRPLAADAETLIVDEVRRQIQDELADDRYDNAAREAARAIALLRSPEALLLDLARIDVAAAAAGEELPALPDIRQGEWSRRWSALRSTAGLDRARAICALASEVHPPSARDAEVLLRRIAAVEKQVVLVRALAESARLMRAQRWQEALDALSAAGEAGQADPRFLQQKASLLLCLEQFAEADEIAARLAASASPVAAEFRGRYPALSAHYRLRCANRLIRAGDLDTAHGILEGCPTADDESLLDVTYARSFCRAMLAYRLRKDGKSDAAVTGLTAALDGLEAHLPLARKREHARFLELQAKLDKDLTDLRMELVS